MQDNTKNLINQDEVELILKLFTDNVRSELIPSDNFIFTQRYFETGQADGLRATSLKMFSDKISREAITAHKAHLNIVCDCLESSLSKKHEDDGTQKSQQGFSGYISGSGMVESGSHLSSEFSQVEMSSALSVATSQIRQIMPIFLERLKTAIQNNCLDSAENIDPHVLSLKSDIFEDVSGVMQGVLTKLPLLHENDVKQKAYKLAEQNFINQWIASVMYSGPQTERSYSMPVDGETAPNVIPLF